MMSLIDQMIGLAQVSIQLIYNITIAFHPIHLKRWYYTPLEKVSIVAISSTNL